MIIYNKIVVSTTEPKEKNVLWYDPSKQDMFWYNDGWTSLTIIPAYRSIEEDIKKLFSMIDVSQEIDSIIEEKVKKWIGEITVNFDNIKINLESKQDKQDKGLATTSKNIVGAINEVLNVAQSGGGINPPQPAPSIEVDTELNKDSSNAIANKAVAEKFEEIEGLIGTGGGSATIEQEIKTNVACGALPAGSTINAGKTFTEVIRLLTSKVLLASRQTSPSATITSTISTTKEVGETIAPTLTATFNDGSFYYYDTGAISTTTIKAGCTATSYQILRGSTVISNSASYTDSYKLPSGNTTYTCKITHSASASDRPTNSDGSVNTGVQFPSNTVTSSSITIKGAYKYFYGSANSLPTDVRSLTNNFSRPSSVNMSGTKWFLYVPKTSTQPTSFKTTLETYTIENETTDNQNNTGVILKKLVKVKDAGGNDVEYYRYMIQLDNPLDSNINIA